MLYVNWTLVYIFHRGLEYHPIIRFVFSCNLTQEMTWPQKRHDRSDWLLWVLWHKTRPWDHRRGGLLLWTRANRNAFCSLLLFWNHMIIRAGCDLRMKIRDLRETYFGKTDFFRTSVLHSGVWKCRPTQKRWNKTTQSVPCGLPKSESMCFFSKWFRFGRPSLHHVGQH